MTSGYRISGPQTLDCEVLIVGSGPGGASVAERLVEAGIDVIMLEEGDYVPASDAPAGISRSMPRLWRGGGLTVAFGNPPIALAEGRCVGGGSEINSAIFQRTPASVLADWAQRFDAETFDQAALSPYYDLAARGVNASATPGELGPPTTILQRAATAMGWQSVELERGQNGCVGTNLCSAACPTGAKQSMTTSLLPGALRRGLRLISGCRVRKIHGKGESARSVTAEARDFAGRTHKLTVRFKTVFVCAGALQSPLLLKRSGLIGGTPSFQLHPTMRVLARFDEAIDAESHRLPLAAITEFMPEMRFGGSVFTLGSFGMALSEDWARRGELLSDADHHAIYYAMIKPEGWGRIGSLPLHGEPLLTYRLTPADLALLAKGTERLSRALLAAGARRVTPSISGHSGWSDPAEIGDLAIDRSRAALMTIHLFSSIPLGGKGPIAADASGRLKGMANVRIADASLIPEAPGVNPQATVMALAYRIADLFLSERPQ